MGKLAIELKKVSIQLTPPQVCAKILKEQIFLRKNLERILIYVEVT